MIELKEVYSYKTETHKGWNPYGFLYKTNFFPLNTQHINFLTFADLYIEYVFKVHSLFELFVCSLIFTQS